MKLRNKIAAAAAAVVLSLGRAAPANAATTVNNTVYNSGSQMLTVQVNGGAQVGIWGGSRRSGVTWVYHQRGHCLSINGKKTCVPSTLSNSYWEALGSGVYYIVQT